MVSLFVLLVVMVVCVVLVVLVVVLLLSLLGPVVGVLVRVVLGRVVMHLLYLLLSRVPMMLFLIALCLRSIPVTALTRLWWVLSILWVWPRVLCTTCLILLLTCPVALVEQLRRLVQLWLRNILRRVLLNIRAFSVLSTFRCAITRWVTPAVCLRLPSVLAATLL